MKSVDKNPALQNDALVVSSRYIALFVQLQGIKREHMATHFLTRVKLENLCEVMRTKNTNEKSIVVKAQSFVHAGVGSLLLRHHPLSRVPVQYSYITLDEIHSSS